MDFVKEPPDSEAFNTIWVVTEGFAKVKNDFLAKTSCTAEDVADSYINNI